MGLALVLLYVLVRIMRSCTTDVRQGKNCYFVLEALGIHVGLLLLKGKMIAKGPLRSLWHVGTRPEWRKCLLRSKRFTDGF